MTARTSACERACQRACVGVGYLDHHGLPAHHMRRTGAKPHAVATRLSPCHVYMSLLMTDEHGALAYPYRMLPSRGLMILGPIDQSRGRWAKELAACELIFVSVGRAHCQQASRGGREGGRIGVVSRGWDKMQGSSAQRARRVQQSVVALWLRMQLRHRVRAMRCSSSAGRRRNVDFEGRRM